MEKYMFCNTVSRIINATRISASFLIIQSAMGMEETVEHILNPKAREWTPKTNQYSTTFVPATFVPYEQTVESQANSSIIDGTPYFNRDDSYVCDGSHSEYGMHPVYSRTREWTSSSINQCPGAYMPYDQTTQFLTNSSIYGGASYPSLDSSLNSNLDGSYPYYEDTAQPAYYGNTHGGNSILHYRQALALATQSNDAGLMIQAYIALGDSHDGQDYGITCYNTALILLGAYGDPKLKAQIYMRIGNVLSSL